MDGRIDLYAEPFAAGGRYVSFRSNLVLRWEWRAGSTVDLVWRQHRAADELDNARATIGDIFGSLGSRGGHFFAVKASYWFSPD